MCTNIVWNSNQRAVYVGRNMDWFEDTRSNMWVMPRGMTRSGMTAHNPATWTSQYGSLVISAYDLATADGFNERGLGVHMLYLPETTTAPRDVAVPGLSIAMWAQWYLDTCGSVAEAVERTREQPFQLQMAEVEAIGKAVTVHLAVTDASGDAAVLECIDGEIQIYHDRRFVVMTNQPTFDQQIANLRQYRGFGGDKALPGTHEPADRFVRGAYYATHLPEPQSEREAVAALMSVMRNTAAPFGISDPDRPNVSTTVWRAIENLNDLVLYFDGVMNPGVFWVDARKLDFSEGAPVMKLEVVGDYDLANDVTDRFLPAEPFTSVTAMEG